MDALLAGLNAAAHVLQEEEENPNFLDWLEAELED
jgi:hypothetical protein